MTIIIFTMTFSLSFLILILKQFSMEWVECIATCIDDNDFLQTLKGEFLTNFKIKSPYEHWSATVRFLRYRVPRKKLFVFFHSIFIQ